MTARYTLMTYRNTNPDYGADNIIEAGSKDEIADGMAGQIMGWAREKISQLLEYDATALDDTSILTPGETWDEHFAALMRAEFISGLEELG